MTATTTATPLSAEQLNIERLAFEKHMVLEVSKLERRIDGGYVAPDASRAWKAWQARAKLAAQDHHPAATTGDDARWMPIEHAPTDGTELLLTHWTPENGYGHVDFGCWGFIENSDYDDSPIYGWLSNYGNIEEPTHFMRVSAPNAIQKEGG